MSMPLWIIFLAVVGGLFAVGFLYDRLARRKRAPHDFRTNPANEFDRVYLESTVMSQNRNDYGGGPL